MKVRSAILPFILAFRLAEPAIRLEMTSGRIISFSRRMNSSPGYEISMMESPCSCNGRREKPAEERENEVS